MKKAALVVGARPQFIKTAPLILGMKRFFETVLIHTGQHYDFMMSDKFFEELKLPKPDYHLESGGNSSGFQIGNMIEGLDSVLTHERPDIAVVIGDTSSTLAGGVSAARLGIALVHVEAGVRSKDKRLPEQINRVVTDSISDCFLCPVPSAVANLRREGKTAHVHDTGDIIYDCLRLFERLIPARPAGIDSLPGKFALATIHRAEAVDNRANLYGILNSLGTSRFPVVFPVHPRTKKMLQVFDLICLIPKNVIMTPPLGYADILSLMKLAEFVVTDSGGVQREAAFMGKPVYVARPETEWIELEGTGRVKVVGYDFDLSAGIFFSKSDASELTRLTRPASETMVEIMNGI